MESLTEHSKVDKKASVSRVAVLAGTPVDTQMGVAVLAAHGLRARGFAMEQGPREQTALQCQRAPQRTAQVQQMLAQIHREGGRQVFVYCNSLSAAVDMEALAMACGLQVVTPMTVYRRWASKYRRLGVLAANAQGLAGIERSLYAANPSLQLWATSLLSVVSAIEEGRAPSEIVETHRLAALAAWFETLGAEAVILGCTHFPYIKAALAAQCALPLLDPTEDMVDLLLAAQGGGHA